MDKEAIVEPEEAVVELAEEIVELAEEIVEPAEAIVEPAEAIVEPAEAIDPQSVLRSSEYDGSQSDVHGTELGFKHVHFPPDASLVKVLILPPLPKKEGIVKKVAKKLCCSSEYST